MLVLLSEKKMKQKVSLTLTITLIKTLMSLRQTLLLQLMSSNTRQNAERFIEGVAAKLDGTWILEFPYTLRTISNASV